MSTRIRYVPSEVPSVLVSARVFPVGENRELRVSLNTADLTFSVFDAKVNYVLTTGKGVSLSNLKLKAKKALEGFGVSFSDEKRNRGKAADSEG
jgi:hypothetical protein